MRIPVQSHGTYKRLNAEVVQARLIQMGSEQLSMVGLNRSFLGPIRLQMLFFFPSAISLATNSGSKTSSLSSMCLDYTREMRHCPQRASFKRSRITY